MLACPLCGGGWGGVGEGGVKVRRGDSASARLVAPPATSERWCGSAGARCGGRFKRTWIRGVEG